ncbi:MAG: hypothetical protein ACFN02_04725, partial [Olsenella profusa]
RSGDKGWEDDYLYVSLHGEWEARVRSLAEPLMGGQPEGTMVCSVGMHDNMIPSDVQGTTLDEVRADVDGFVSVFISADSPLSEEELSELHDRLVANLRSSGMRIDVFTCKVTDPLDGQPFMEDFVSNSEGRTWERTSYVKPGGE